MSIAQAFAQTSSSIKVLEMQTDGKLSSVMRPLSKDLKTVQLPDQDEFNEIQAIKGKLVKDGAKFKSISAGTWQKLDHQARISLLANYRIAKQGPVNSGLQQTLDNLTNKANLHALSALARSGVEDSRIADEFKLPQSNLLAQPWTMPVGNKLTPITMPTAQERAGLNYYQSWHNLRHGLNNFNRAGVVEPLIVGSGSPQPRVPGEPLTPITLVPVETPVPTESRTLARRPRPFNPAGFLEVVRIEYSSDTDSCSGTLLAPTLVLTAAHCVYKRAEQTIEVLVPSFSAEKMAKCKKILAEQGVYEQCVDLTKVTAASVVCHPDYNDVKKDNDIALITLARAVPGSYSAAIRFAAAKPEAISLAGYGVNGLVSQRTLEMSRAIEVGWHNGVVVQGQDGRIGWQFSRSSDGSATCVGDSGGPIYAGDYDGGTDAGKHSIFALATAGSDTNCEDFHVIQTPLALPPIREWLCKVPQVSELVSTCADPG
ncbi:MAG: trypsin-like serine protease [Candidatus Nitrotoga sp.]